MSSSTRGDAPSVSGIGQQAQGVAGRRGVHDDLVVAAARGQARQLEQPDQLVHAGQREPEQPLDVVVVEVGARARRCAASAARRVAEPAARARRRRPARPRGAVPGARARARDARRERGAERVAERVGGIGGHEEDAAPRSARRQRRRGRAGGLADAALAPEEASSAQRAAPGPPAASSASSPLHDVGLDARDAQRARGLRRPRAALAHLADGRRAAPRSMRGELRLVDLAQLEPHLGGEQLLAETVSSSISASTAAAILLEHEADAADEERVEDQHGYSAPARARA